MKKVKIILAAIGVLAVAGGAMAFKAKGNFGTVQLYTTSAAGTNVTCPYTVATMAKSSLTQTIFASTSKGGTCATLNYVRDEE